MEMPTLVARGLPGHGPGLEAEQRQSVAFGGDGTASQRHVDLSVSLAHDSCLLRGTLTHISNCPDDGCGLGKADGEYRGYG